MAHISIAAAAPEGTIPHNTESLRVEELIPEQLRASSEKFVELISDYYEYMNTVDLPTYETNRIVSEHDIDKVSNKYLDGIQSEIAKNIPNSTVMNRGELYKKIVKFYTLKGSHESVSTFFRLFFDEIIHVSYPKDYLFKLSDGDWRQNPDKYIKKITGSLSYGYKIDELNHTPFILKNSLPDPTTLITDLIDSNVDDEPLVQEKISNIIGGGKIIDTKPIDLYNHAPSVYNLSVDLYIENNFNAAAGTWDSTAADLTWRGYLKNGARYLRPENNITFDGTRAHLDFGKITDRGVDLSPDEHTIVVRAKKNISTACDVVQPLFNLSDSFSKLSSHELLFDYETGKIGRSWINTEANIALNIDGESLELINFLDSDTTELGELTGDAYTEINKFMTAEDRFGYPRSITPLNGVWNKTAAIFNGEPVYVPTTSLANNISGADLDQMPETGTAWPDFTFTAGLRPNFPTAENIRSISCSVDGSIVAVSSRSALTGEVNLYGNYLRPDGVSEYFQPDGTSTYNTPGALPNNQVYKTNVYAWDEVTNAWNQLGSTIYVAASADVVFGPRSTSLSADGTKLAIGVIGPDSNRGSVSVYQYSGNTWTQIGQDIDGEESLDQSGSSITLSADGTILAIGAAYNDGNDGERLDEGHVRVYQYSNNSWAQIGDDIDGENADDYSGESISLSADGTILAIGAAYNDDNGDESGHVRVYQYSNNAWAQIGDDIDGENADDYSGGRVSLSADGTILAIGGRRITGSTVKTFKYSNGVWSQFGQSILNDRTYAVTLSDNASRLLVQSYYDSQTLNPGQTIVYTYSSSVRQWLVESVFSHDDETHSVCMSGNGRHIVAAVGILPTTYDIADIYDEPRFLDFQKVLFFEENPLDTLEGRWVINLDGSRLYHTDYTDVTNRSRPWDLTTRWFKNVEGTEGNFEFPISTESTTNLAHRYTNKTVKKEGDYLLRLKNYGLLSVYIKRNNSEYDLLQNISLGDTTEYDGSRIYGIADYDVEGEYLTVLDTGLSKPRVVIFKKGTSDRYEFDQTLNLQLLDFGSIKLRGSSIIVGTLPIGNDHKRQVINAYDANRDMVWSESEFANLGHSTELPTNSPEIEYDFRNNPIVAPVEYPILESVNFSDANTRTVTVQFKANEDYKLGGKLFEIGSQTSTGLGLGDDKFTIALGWDQNITFSSDRYPWILLRDSDYPETDARYTEAQPITFKPGVVHTLTVTITGKSRDIKESTTGTVTPDYLLELSVTLDGVLIGTGILVKSYLNSPFQLTSFYNSDYSVKKAHIENAFNPGATIQLGDDDLNAEILYASVYNRITTDTENYNIHTYLESDSADLGVNTKLDYGNFDVNQNGNIVAKVVGFGVHIWEKTSSGWEYKFNSSDDIGISAVKKSKAIIPRSGGDKTPAVYSYAFFGDLLLVADGGDYEDYTGLVHSYENFGPFGYIANDGAFTTDTTKNETERLYSLASRFETNNRMWGIRSVINAILSTSVDTIATSDIAGSPKLAEGSYSTFIGGHELEFSADTLGAITIDTNVAISSSDIIPNVYIESLPAGSNNYVVVNFTWTKDVGKYATDITVDTENGAIAISKTSDTFLKYDVFGYTFGVWTNTSVFGVDVNVDYSTTYPFHAALDKNDIFLSTKAGDDAIDFYRYDGINDKVWEKQQEIYNDFVATTVQGLIYHDSETEIMKASEYTNIIIRSKADRYNGKVEVSVNGGDFTTIISGNTAYGLNIASDSRLTIGRLDGNTGKIEDDSYLCGAITHAQYYNRSITDDEKDTVIEYLEKSPLDFYEITIGDLVGDVTDAAKIAYDPTREERFIFENLDGHLINGFWSYDNEEGISGVNANVKAKYDSSVSYLQNVYWGDGRDSRIISNARAGHVYSSNFLGEYKDRKGRISSVNRIHDGVYWQDYSYSIKSSIRIEDWEKQFLSLVHPAGLRFFASVLLLVIRDNHWYGPTKRVKYDNILRKNLNLIKVEDNFLSPFRTKQPVNDLRWLESLTAPNETGGYHLPLFQPGWLQGDIRVREFIFAAAEWTNIARIVPGNQKNQGATKYTHSYFANDPKTDSEISVINYSGSELKLNDVIYQDIDNNILRGVVVKIDADGNGGIVRLEGTQKKIENTLEVNRDYDSAATSPNSRLDGEGWQTEAEEYVVLDLNPDDVLETNPDIYGVITQGGIAHDVNNFVKLGSDVDGISAGISTFELNHDGTIFITGVRNTGPTGLVRVWQWREWSANDDSADYNYTTRPLSGTLPIIVTGSAQDTPGLGVAPTDGVYYWTQLGLDIVGDPIRTTGGSSSQAWTTAGSAVAISDDGMTIAVGDSGGSNAGLKYNGSSKVYDYDTPTKDWVQRGETIWGIQSHSYSGPKTLSADGNRMVVAFHVENANGKRDTGVIRTYDWVAADAEWVESVMALTGSHSWEYFGDDATLSADGNTLSVASWGDDDRPTSDNPWGPRDGSDGINFKDRKGSVSVYKYYAHPEGTTVNPIEQDRTYSGYYQDGADFRRSELDSPQAWSAASSDLSLNPWMQIDLGSIQTVSGIVTQARADLQQWVTSLNIQYSINGTDFFPVVPPLYYSLTLTWDTSVPNDSVITAVALTSGSIPDGSYTLTIPGATGDDLVFTSTSNVLTITTNTVTYDGSTTLPATTIDVPFDGFDADSGFIFNSTPTNILIKADKKEILFAAAVEARYIRVFPKSYRGYPSMRAGVITPEGVKSWQQIGQTIYGEFDGDHARGEISRDGRRLLHRTYSLYLDRSPSMGNTTGTTKVFEYTGSTWVQMGDTFVGDIGIGQRLLGSSISEDGSRIAIGDIYHDGVSLIKVGISTVYDWNSTEWIEVSSVTGENAFDYSWRGVLSGDGSRIMLASGHNDDAGPNAGSVKVYEQETVTGWVTAIEVETSDDNSNWTKVDNGNNFATGNVDYNTKSFIEFSDEVLAESPLVDKPRYLKIIPKAGTTTMVLRAAALIKSALTKFSDGDIYTLNVDNPTEASIRTFPIKRKDTVMEVYDTATNGAAYIDDQATIDANAERFLRAVLTTFKYVIPTFEPRDHIAKHDYQQNLKFKDWNDISSYLNLTIADAISDQCVFTNLGARMIKRNPLESEDGQIFTLEKHVVGSDANNNILIDDVAEWWNDPENPNDVSAPVQATTSVTTINIGDMVYQDVQDEEGDNITIGGLIIDKPNETTLMIAWKSGVNTTTDVTLPSMPEYDILFRDGDIYTLDDTPKTAIITIANT